MWVARKLQEEMKRINPLDSFGWNAGTRHFDNVPAVPAVNNVSRAVPDKNVDYHTNLIHKFINKLSDM